jgi:ornithine cyclodeaminase
VPLILDEPSVASLLTMDDLIPLMRKTLAEFSSGRARQPVRAAVPLEAGAALYVMPGYLPESRAAAIKAVSLAPGNSERGLPTHFATLLLFDPETGALLAMMDGRLVTEMRTAAVSAAAADALASREARTLAILGTGVQARSHLEALRLVRPIERVRVWSPTLEHREAFAREMSKTGTLDVVAASSAEEAVRGAEVIVTATLSAEPVLRGAWLAPGACVVAVGASRSDAREVDGETVRRARCFVDSRAAADVEAGDLLLAIQEGAITVDHVAGEIGEVFAGSIPGRTSGAGITFFKSLGQAVEDAAAAKLVYDRARVAGTGVEIDV